MKKKVLSALLVAAMSVSVLAGCGSKADNKTDAKNDASQENTLSVWCWDPNFNVYAMKQAEAIYQKDHPDFKLESIGLIEKENELDGTYKVLSAFHYMEDLVDCITISEEVQDEIPE